MIKQPPLLFDEQFPKTEQFPQVKFEVHFKGSRKGWLQTIVVTIALDSKLVML